MGSKYRYAGICTGRVALLSTTVSAPLCYTNCVDGEGPVGERFKCPCGKRHSLPAPFLEWRMATDDDRDAFEGALAKVER